MLLIFLTAMLSSPLHAQSSALSEALRLQGQAVEMVEEAYRNTRKARWKRLARGLAGRRLQEGMFCDHGMAAMAIPFTGRIGICESFIGFAQRGDEEVMGVLIHEALHLIGQINECRADEEVREVMEDAGYGSYMGVYC